MYPFHEVSHKPNVKVNSCWNKSPGLITWKIWLLFPWFTLFTLKRIAKLVISIVSIRLGFTQKVCCTMPLSHIRLKWTSGCSPSASESKLPLCRAVDGSMSGWKRIPDPVSVASCFLKLMNHYRVPARYLQ